MVGVSEIEVRAVAWSPVVHDFLAPVQAGDLDGVEGLAQDVQAGRATAFEILAGGRAVGAFVLRVESFYHGAEVVGVAAGGNLPGVDLTASIMPFVEAVARKAGAASVRIHTRRPGLIQKLREQGYHKAEVIMQKGLC